VTSIVPRRHAAVPTEFEVADDDGLRTLDAIRDALTARVEPRRIERRAWLDTFDWRLYNAGLLLEHRARADQSSLVLSDVAGQRIARLPTSQSVERVVSQLPAGPIREQVTKLGGPRALFVRVAVDGAVTVLFAVDDEEKTVARVAVEGPFAVDGGDMLPPRLRVEPLRGYRKQARTVAKRLATMSALRRVDEPLFRVACSAIGLEPGVYRSTPDVRLDAEMPARLAFAALLHELVDIARVNVDGTMRQLDIEFLHDLRVAVRRSRAALKVAKRVYNEPLRARYAAEFKWIGDITTPSRDLDVYLRGFDELVAHAMDPEAMRPFRSLLTGQRREAHTALNRALRSKRFARLLEDWPEDLAASDEQGPDADTATVQVANDRLRAARRRVHKRGRAITATSPAESLHDLRKRCKELRYLLEFFAHLYQTSAHREVVAELKRLQDNLGEFQDAESQRDLILQYAEGLTAADAPAATLIGMGRLDHHFEQRQTAARAEFAARWARFDRKHNRRVFTTMLGAR
jgi:CHAD domain-containing protein